MSISFDAKLELCRISHNECCLAAKLSALIHSAGAIGFSSGGMSVTVETDNKEVFLFVDNAVKSLYGQGAKKQAGRIVISGDFITDMLLDLRILKLLDGFKVEEGINPSLIANDCCKSAYLAGAFMGGGSLTVSGGYHLEFACLSKKLRDGIIKLLGETEIKAGATVRGDSFIAYLKDSDRVSDCLVFMGANKTCLKLNSLLVERSVKQNAARAANCDMANLNRMISASLLQRQAIDKLKKANSPKLSGNKKLLEAAQVRQDYPDFNYEELAEVLSISKSTIKYRLNQIVKAAEEL